jgi:amino-acid N-acetyltransferase
VQVTRARRAAIPAASDPPVDIPTTFRPSARHGRLLSAGRCSRESRPNAFDTVALVTVVVRRARTADVPAIKAIVDIYAGSGRRLLAKELVTLYEDVQDFVVAEIDGMVVGCGALHVLWADLGEVRTLAVHPDHVNARIGRDVLDGLIATARKLGLSRLFALTFHTGFFSRAGFVPIEGAPVDQDTYDALRRSYDAGVAEFLNLEYVKPNTLGNTRMLLNLA